MRDNDGTAGQGLTAHQWGQKLSTVLGGGTLCFLGLRSAFTLFGVYSRQQVRSSSCLTEIRRAETYGHTLHVQTQEPPDQRREAVRPLRRPVLIALSGLASVLVLKLLRKKREV